MLRKLNGLTRIYIACGRTDLRKGIDGLATIIKENFNLDPFQTDVLFLFCGTKRDRFKGLIWEGDGFLLLYKRVEAGSFKWPRTADEVRDITPEQFRKLLDGLTVIEEPSIKPGPPPKAIL